MEYKGFKQTKAMLAEMTNFLYECGFRGDFTYTGYPAQLRVAPYKKQIDLFAKEEQKEPSLTLSLWINNITYAFDGNLTINEDVFNKIKTYAKKLHYTWLQEYFAALVAGGQRINTIEEYDIIFDDSED